MIHKTNRGPLLIFCVVLAVLLSSVNAYSGVSDKVIVVVNEELITQREFDRLFVPVKKNIDKRFEGKDAEEKIERAKAGMLEQLINSKLAISIAKKNKIEIDEGILEERIDKIKSFYKTEEEFLQTLSAKGTNLSEFEQDIRDQMLAQELIAQEVRAKIVVTPTEIQELYEKNKEQLVAPKLVKARSIMIKKSGQRPVELEKQMIDEIVRELNDGRNFAEVAKEKSEGPYAKAGGDIGQIAEGQMKKDLEDVIFSLKEGEKSDIIETSLGFHVFLAEKIDEPRKLSLGEVNDYLREQLYMKKFQEDVIKWLEEKKKDAYISYK